MASPETLRCGIRENDWRRGHIRNDSDVHASLFTRRQELLTVVAMVEYSLQRATEKTRTDVARICKIMTGWNTLKCWESNTDQKISDIIRRVLASAHRGVSRTSEDGQQQLGLLELLEEAWALRLGFAQLADPQPGVPLLNTRYPVGPPLRLSNIGRALRNQSLFKEIFADIKGPFDRVALDRCWGSSTVMDLVRQIYDNRSFDRMPILADALMDAGCDSEEVINHCRSEKPHVRGCWVLDLLQGKDNP